MRRSTFITIAIAALIASSSAITFQSKAGATTDLTTANSFGSGLASSYASASFRNGNTDATITIDPYLALNFDSNIAAAFNNANVVAASKLAAGIRVTADTTGSGTLTVTFNAAFRTLVAASASQFVLISTPVGTASGSASEAIYIPPNTADFESGNSISWSIAFNRNYVIVALTANANVGASAAAAFQAAFNTTSRVAANAYLQFSASSNAKSSSNTNTASGSASGGNPYVQFFSSSDAQLRVNQWVVGSSASGKTYATPAGTTNNAGFQYSITKTSGSFNGNLVYNSNGRGGFNAAQASSYSWFKASSDTAGSSGWTKVTSTSTVDGNGNLVVTAQQSGDFSEWTVAQSSASAVAAGILAIVAFVAIAL